MCRMYTAFDKIHLLSKTNFVIQNKFNTTRIQPLNSKLNYHRKSVVQFLRKHLHDIYMAFPK